jgi:hypothetical protein
VVAIIVGLGFAGGAVFVRFLLTEGLGEYGYNKPQWVPFGRVVAKAMIAGGLLIALAGLVSLFLPGTPPRSN